MILDRLAKLDMRERLGLLVALLFVLGFAIDWLVVRPLVRRYRELGTEIVGQEEQLAYYLGVIEEGPRIQSEYDAISALPSRARSAPEAINAMKGDIDDLAQRTGVVVFSMEDRKPRTDAFYDEYVIEVTRFESNMSQLLEFLYAIRSAPGMMRVGNLTLDGGGENSAMRGTMLITKVTLPSEGAPEEAL